MRAKKAKSFISSKTYHIRYNFHKTLRSNHFKTKKSYEYWSCRKKTKYLENEALILTVRMNGLDYFVTRMVHHYKCDFCEYWHIGRRRTETPSKFQSRYLSDRFMLANEMELGYRAAGCLYQENYKKKHLKKMFASVQRKYYN